MRTKGSALKNKINDSIFEIQRLLGISHQEEDYAILFKIMGGEVEKSLKTTVFQNTLNDKNFFELINNLTTLGISQKSIDSLHEFRKTYNGYKHDSTYSIELIDAKVIFENTLKSIEELILQNVGIINHPHIEKSKRLVWFSGWDDYIGGMVETGIFIPDYSVDFPYEIEHFNISFDGWDSVVRKFTSTGELKLGEQYVSPRAYKVWKNEGDFVNSGSFNGDISEFIQELSKYPASIEKELLPFLKRENDSSSVKAAIVFSLFDCVRQNSCQDSQDLLDEIVLRASYDYGINIESPYLKSYITKIDTKTIISRKDSLKNIEDILWLDSKDYDQLKDKILSEELYIAIDKENRIITRII